MCVLYTSGIKYFIYYCATRVLYRTTSTQQQRVCERDFCGKRKKKKRENYERHRLYPSPFSVFFYHYNRHILKKKKQKK